MDRNIAYACIVVDSRLQEYNQNGVGIAIGKTIIEYSHKVTTQTEDCFTAKMLWNK